MLVAAHLAAFRPLGSPSRYYYNGSKKPLRRRAVVYCSAESGEPQHASMRNKAAVLLTGIAAACLAISPEPAQAANLESRSKERTAELTATLEESKELEAKLERMLEGAAAAPQALEASAQAKLDRANAEIKRILALVNEVENSVLTAVKNEENLQAQLASETAEAMRLRTELRTSKKELEGQKQVLAAEIQQIEKELETQKKLLAAAKQQAEEQATAAAQAAVEETLPSRYALQGTVGVMTLWGLSTYWNMKKRAGAPAAEAAPVMDGGVPVAEKTVLPATQVPSVAMQALEHELQQARELVEKANKELQAAAAARKQVEAEKGLKEAEVSAMQIKLRELQHQVDNTNQALGKERLALQKTRRKCEALTSQVADLQNQLAKSATEKEELRRVIKSLEDKLSHTLSLAESEATELKRQLDELAEAQALSSQMWNISGPAAQPKLVNVQLKLQRELQLGQGVVVVGSHPALGGWDLRSGAKMSWGEGHIWQSEVTLPPGSTVEFKCVILDEGQEGWSQWEEGHNHVLHVPLSNGTTSIEVRVEWGVGEVITNRRPGLDEPLTLHLTGKVGEGAEVSMVALERVFLQ